MVEGGQWAPCQALSDTAVLTTRGPGAASAIGRLKSEQGRMGAAPHLRGVQPRGGGSLAGPAPRACDHAHLPLSRHGVGFPGRADPTLAIDSHYKAALLKLRSRTAGGSFANLLARGWGSRCRWEKGRIASSGPGMCRHGAGCFPHEPWRNLGIENVDQEAGAAPCRW